MDDKFSRKVFCDGMRDGFPSRWDILPYPSPWELLQDTLVSLPCRDSLPVF